MSIPLAASAVVDYECVFSERECALNRVRISVVPDDNGVLATRSTHTQRHFQFSRRIETVRFPDRCLDTCTSCGGVRVYNKKHNFSTSKSRATQRGILVAPRSSVVVVGACRRFFSFPPCFRHLIERGLIFVIPAEFTVYFLFLRFRFLKQCTRQDSFFFTFRSKVRATYL